MPREHGESGEYVETVTLEDVLGVFDDVRGPVVLSADVADTLECSRETARRKLSELYDRGEVDRRKVSRRVIYWRGHESDTPSMNEGLPTGPGDVTRDTVGEDTARADAEGETSKPSGGTPADTHGDESDALAERVRRYLEDTDTPPKTEHGRSAVMDVFRYLREHGSAKTGGIQDAVYPDYADEWGSARTMWNALDRYLADVPGIEKGGYGKWTYTDDESVREELGGGR